MAKSYTPLLVLIAACFAAVASAQPCIECQDCRGMQSCYQVCKSSCPRPQPVVNGEICKTYGTMSGNSAAQKACDMTKTYCSGGMGSAPYFPVPLSQCANIAFGTCQNRAMDRWSSPCGQHFNGYKQCDSAAFMKFYTGLVNDGCHQAVSWIQDAAALAAKLG